MNWPITVEGWADPAFNTCLDAFRSNFGQDGELGAACAIYHNGEPVLDVWGGAATADGGQPWRRDTVAPVFSVTKGVAALCVLAQVDEGLIDLDAPVARYWPEFGEHGKDRVTVRQALGHRAGVPAISGAITLENLADPAAMAARLGSELPIFDPNTAHIYHPITIGWITSELVRRVTGLSVGQWLRKHVAEPLQLNLQIGRLPADNSPIARFMVPPERDSPELEADSLAAQAISLSGLMEPRLSGLAKGMNDPRLQAVELAGANGLADARSLARLYSAVLTGAEGISLPSMACVRDARTPISQGKQWMTDFTGPTWGAGLMLPWAVQPMLGQGSFGHDGMGGALAFAHEPSGISFAYVRNRAGIANIADPLVYRVVGILADKLGITIPTF